MFEDDDDDDVVAVFEAEVFDFEDDETEVEEERLVFSFICGGIFTALSTAFFKVDELLLGVAPLTLRISCTLTGAPTATSGVFVASLNASVGSYCITVPPV